MTIDAWLQAALSDADRRGLPNLKPLLETLARATKALRDADFNDDASGVAPSNEGARHDSGPTLPSGRSKP
jgi:hypothetical protein